MEEEQEQEVILMPQAVDIVTSLRQSCIPMERWVEVVASDPDLAVAGDSDEPPLAVYWTGWPDYDPDKPIEAAPSFEFFEGLIICSRQDRHQIGKACALAEKLGGFVVGDDNERYDSSGSISLPNDGEGKEWEVDTRWRWDDPEFYRLPTPEDYFQMPGWQQACKRVWYAFKRRFGPKA